MCVVHSLTPHAIIPRCVIHSHARGTSAAGRGGEGDEEGEGKAGRGGVGEDGERQVEWEEASEGLGKAGGRAEEARQAGTPPKIANPPFGFS